MAASEDSRLPVAGRAVSATIAPHLLRYLSVVSAEAEFSIDEVLETALLSPDMLDAPHLRVSFRQGASVIAAALERGSRPDLGLLVGARQHISASGLVGWGMMSAPTLIDAIRLGIEYQNLAGSMVSWSVHTSATGVTTVQADLVSSGTDPRVSRFLLEEGFANITQMVRTAMDPRFCPAAVSFTFPEPGHAPAYHEYFDCPLTFSAADNRWQLPAGVEKHPLPGADRWAHEESRQLLHEHLRHLGDRQELYELVEARIQRALPQVPTMRDTAAALHLTERTLRRRLAEMGSSFAQILDGVRRERALALLELGDSPIAAIAAAMGFADERSLRRATARWRGKSPRSLRDSTAGNTTGASWHDGHDAPDQPRARG